MYNKLNMDKVVIIDMELLREQILLQCSDKELTKLAVAFYKVNFWKDIDMWKL